MTELEKIFAEKKTENGDISYKTTGNNLTDLLFMTNYFEKNLNEVKIGDTTREKLFSMYVRDPRFGMGRRDLGRKLMKLSGVEPKWIAKAGRMDDLWHIPTENNIKFLRFMLFVEQDELAKKWMPRLTGKDKKIAKAICKEWGISEKDYRKLIKTDSTTEYKLSYAEKIEGTPLNDVFNKNEYIHPLVDAIDFEKVPSLAMTKYLNTFSTRDDFKERFAKYISDVKENKAKVNVATSNVTIAHKTVNAGWTTQSLQEDAAEVIASKTVENETVGVALNCICILDTSASMYWGKKIEGETIGDKATAVCHALATHSTYAPNQLISFSSNPKLMTIKGNTLKEQYKSMYTGDCSNTDFGKVMRLLQGLKKYPEYIIVLSDMEFDEGSNMSKERTMRLFRENGANTKIIWWNFNNRNTTTSEVDEYGNYYLSGYNMQILRLLNNKLDMSEYIDKILAKYAKNIDYKI